WTTHYCETIGLQGQDWACTGLAGWNLHLPYGVAVSSDQTVFITDQVANSSPLISNLRIIKPGCTDPQQQSNPCYLTISLAAIQANKMRVAPAGNLFIAVYPPAEVLELPAGCTSASCMRQIPASLNTPSAVAIDTTGNLFIADGSRIVKRNLGSLDAG